MNARLADRFLREPGQLLANAGFEGDPDRMESGPSGFVFYHFTREKHLRDILAEDSGLNAQLPIPCPEPPDELAGHYAVGGFLQPCPRWLDRSPYFQDLGRQMLRENVGGVPLRVCVPLDFAGLYVADFAHYLECKYHERNGRFPMGLGYDCRNGREVTQAYVNSWIPLGKYGGGHVAPIVEVTREGPGLVVPSRFIEIWDDRRRT
ncbi:MAG: hypothetical protein OXG11_12885 [Chloroflexi bacterium]|nr:hypothetical protein [Chloroflexota bacterium]